MTTIEAELARRGWKGSDYLKIDVEGYDLHALRGAGAMLTERKFGIVQFEYNVPWAEAGSTLTIQLTSSGMTTRSSSQPSTGMKSGRMSIGLMRYSACWLMQG